jgi:carotenoid cleavage dioxygenase-like enzyme
MKRLEKTQIEEALVLLGEHLRSENLGPFRLVVCGPGKHLADLLSLDPTDIELEQAAKWALTHDISEGFHTTLNEIFIKIGRDDVAGRI